MGSWRCRTFRVVRYAWPLGFGLLAHGLIAALQQTKRVEALLWVDWWELGTYEQLLQGGAARVGGLEFFFETRSRQVREHRGARGTSKAWVGTAIASLRTDPERQLLQQYVQVRDNEAFFVASCSNRLSNHPLTHPRRGALLSSRFFVHRADLDGSALEKTNSS